MNLINFTETKTNRDRAVPLEPIVREDLLELNQQSGDAEYVLRILTPERGTRIKEVVFRSVSGSGHY